MGVIMTISALLEDFRSEFKSHGSFTLAPGQSIGIAAREHNVPNEPGVYVISSIKSQRKKLIYIGKAGTVTTNGLWKKQGLHERLTMKQRNESRIAFFRNFIRENHLSGLHFEWFVTFRDPSISVLPLFAEAQLLQAFFSEHRCLPQLNSSA